MIKKIYFAAIALLFYILPASSLKSDEDIVFYDTFGYYKNGKLHLTVHGQVYEKKENSAWRHLLISSLKKFITAKDSNEIFTARIKPFLNDNQRNKIINILLNGENYSLNFTAPDGHTVTEIIQDSSRYPAGRPRIITFSSQPSPNNSNRYSGKISIIPTRGISVISDIDDTIKESKVNDKKELLKNTFEKDYQPVAGMPELYTVFKNKGADFHYLSASPWQLYKPVSEFIEQFYPDGVKYFKKFRIKDSSIIDFIFQNQTDYKLAAISDIVEKFPGHSFILVGDTGEKDQEIYAKAAALYPKQIISIYLRLTDKKKPAENIRRLYSNIKTVQLFVFSDPKELQLLKQ